MSNELFNKTSVKELRRELRRNQTNAEKLLWDALRDRRLAGAKFRRQHSIGTYVVDFYCAEAALVIELDGSVHDSPEAQVYDREREAVICNLGLSMMRFRNNDVERRLNYVLEKIAENLNTEYPRVQQERIAKGNESKTLRIQQLNSSAPPSP